MAPFVMVSPSRGYFTFSTDATLIAACALMLECPAVPAASRWSLLALVLLLGIAGILQVRQRLI
jgi:hypothetical protein